MTLVVYGAFPVIFAKTRTTPISKKKYKRLCYGINFIGLIFFVAVNGTASGGPYILWTWIFSNYGVKTLDAKGLLDVISTANEGCVDVSGNNEAISFCRKCGAKLDSDSRFCCKCGTEIKEEV